MTIPNVRNPRSPRPVLYVLIRHSKSAPGSEKEVLCSFLVRSEAQAAAVHLALINPANWYSVKPKDEVDA